MLAILVLRTVKMRPVPQSGFPILWQNISCATARMVIKISEAGRHGRTVAHVYFTAWKVILYPMQSHETLYNPHEPIRNFDTEIFR